MDKPREVLPIWQEAIKSLMDTGAKIDHIEVDRKTLDAILMEMSVLDRRNGGRVVKPNPVTIAQIYGVFVTVTPPHHTPHQPFVTPQSPCAG